MRPPPPVDDKYTKFSCPNQACSLFDQPGQGTIVHRSWTGKRKDMERLQCTLCGQEFSEREGTVMARSTLLEETGERWVKCQRWGVCDAGTADICEVDIKTVHRFQRLAATRAAEHHCQVVRRVEVAGGQLGEGFSRLHRGMTVWLHTALAIGSLFLLWVEVGPRTQDTAALVLARVVARVQMVPVWFSDGWHAYPAALLQVLGRVYRRRRRGTVGRKPKPRLVAPKTLFYAQVGKVRNATGRVMAVSTRVIFGGPRRFFKAMRRRGLGQTIQTAFMERWYGTLRGLGAPLRRRTRCLSWNPTRHRGRVWLLVSLYHVVMPHKSVRHGKHHRTPAMAIGLTDHVWSYHEYMWLPVHTDPHAQQEMAQRIEHLLPPALPDSSEPKASTTSPVKQAKKKRVKPMKKTTKAHVRPVKKAA
jgi:hypothetical protein